MNNDLFQIDLEDVIRREAALTTILKQMDVPSLVLDTANIRNLHWLNRNLKINNGQHPLFQTAAGLTTWLLKWHTADQERVNNDA